MKRKLIFIFTILSLVGLVIAADSPYASRIRPSTTHTGSCAENSVLYDMTNHTPYYCSDSGWTAFGSGGGGAPIDATYITQTVNGTLTNEQALSALSTGILKNTTTTGVLSIAVAGTDYQVPITAGDVTTSGATSTIGALKVTNAMLAGSIADSKLSANVMLLDAVQAITGAKTFNPAKLIIGTNAGAPAVVANSFYRETGDSKLYIGNAAGSAWDEIFEAGVSLVNLTSNVTGVLPGTNGGTGVNNSTRLITVSGNFTTTGAFNTILATGFTGTITLPTATSTLATLALTETLTNKSLTSPLITNLTAGRVTFAGASGLLTDDSDLTFLTDTLTFTKGAATTSLTVAGAAITNNVVQNSQSAAYTTVLADAGKHIYHPSADTTARTWTIDSNTNVAYPVGTTITFVNDTSGGVITIAITSDTLVLAGAGTTGNRTLAANGIATAIKVTSTRWVINGTGLT